MKKNVKNKTYQPRVNYESESVNVTMECCKYLLENNFYENSIKDNLQLIEQFLINFSQEKMISWKRNINIININQLETLSSIINSYIPTHSQREAYFNQYVHCIIYLLGVMNKQTQIEWKKENIGFYNIEIKYNDKYIIEIVTDKNLDSYLVPFILLDKLNSIYIKEEVPVLKK